MFATLLVVVAVISFAEGVMLTSLVTLRGKPAWLFVPLITAVFVWWIYRVADRRAEKHESDRMAWRKGALGEYEVGAELERLSDDFFVFHDINTEEFGNFDHIAVGPKGVFAIETKNWTGLIGADGAGELTRNGKSSSQAHVQRLEQKVMMLREQILILTRRDDLFVRGVMVFPKAALEAEGKTRNVHCVRIERLFDYIEKAPKRLEAHEVDKIARAVKGVAYMNSEVRSDEMAAT